MLSQQWGTQWFLAQSSNFMDHCLLSLDATLSKQTEQANQKPVVLFAVCAAPIPEKGAVQSCTVHPMAWDSAGAILLRDGAHSRKCNLLIFNY